MKENTFTELLERGGLIRGLEGRTAQEMLALIVDAIILPENLDKQTFLQAVLERESLMPTSIGNGIATPHPRNPMLSDPADEFVVICFPKNPIEWQALDNIPVKAILLIASAAPRSHLHTLSRVHFFCQQPAFHKLLEEQAPKEEILKLTSAIEKEWK